MKIETKIYFGCGQRKDGTLIKAWSRGNALEVIRRVTCDMFQGYTLLRSEGGWRPLGRVNVVVEESRVLVLLTEGMPNMVHIAELIAVIKRELDQETVTVTAAEVAMVEV